MDKHIFDNVKPFLLINASIFSAFPRDTLFWDYNQEINFHLFLHFQRKFLMQMQNSVAALRKCYSLDIKNFACAIFIMPEK